MVEERVKRKYVRKPIPDCDNCPVKAEMERWKTIYKGYRLAIMDLGGKKTE